MSPPRAPPRAQSINSLLRAHCREPLFVPPLVWTERHLQLLNCRFVVSADEYDTDWSSRRDWDPEDTLASDVATSGVERCARMLAHRQSVWSKRNAVQGLLDYPGSIFCSSRRVCPLSPA